MHINKMCKQATAVWPDVQQRFLEIPVEEGEGGGGAGGVQGDLLEAQEAQNSCYTPMLP